MKDTGFAGPYDKPIRIVFSFEDCLRQCLPCGIGLSNARTAPTVIFKNPLDNIPPEVREGALEVLAAALNERNRKNELAKFGFQTSEDAVTWTVFSYLARSGLLGPTLDKLVGHIVKRQSTTSTLLLWGTPFPKSDAGAAVRDRLLEASDRLDEDAMSRSEPDVLVQRSDGSLIAIEVKYRSANDSKRPNYHGWSKGYLYGSSAFRDPNLARNCGLYELVRNWRIASELAQGKPFVLVNLCLDFVAEDEQVKRMAQFKDSLIVDPSASFQISRWRDLISAIPETPSWLLGYLRSKGITATHHGPGI